MKKEVKSMTKTTAPIKEQTTCEAGAFTRRIGHTVYCVGVHFSGTSTETVKDKILRLAKTEAQSEKAAINQ
jgi:hypothetical protein